MSKLSFIIKKTLMLSLALFAVIAEIIFTLGLPAIVMSIMHSESENYFWLYAISLPFGIGAIIATVSTVEWGELIDFYDYDHNNRTDNDY